MHIISAKMTPGKVSHVIDTFNNHDPLILRKKIGISDTYYRRGCPEHELVHAELAMDTEMSVLLLAGAIGALAILCALGSWRKKRLRRKYERATFKAKAKT